jgi:thiopeptide-type bacteriocin biosynthesis protein
MAAGQVSRFGFDTYERELERYGGPSGIAWAETFFAADSSSVADMLNQLDGGDGFDRLSLLAISVDRLLEDLGLDETARPTWCKQQASSRHIGGSEYRERKAASCRV